MVAAERLAQQIEKSGLHATTPSVTKLRDARLQVDSAIVWTGDEPHEPSTYLHRQIFAHNQPADPISIRPGTSAVTYNAGWRNYYHWTVQAVFSAWLIGRMKIPCDQYIFPPVPTGHRRLLELAGVPSDLCRFEDKSASLHLESANVVDAAYANFVYRPSSLLRAYSEDVAARAIVGDSFATHIYVSRADSPKRPMRNEEELIAQLERRGFLSVSLTGMSIDAQVATFSAASTIVAPHGAGLTNIIYAAPGARVFELTSQQYVNPCFAALASVLDLEYHVDIHGDFGPGDAGDSWLTDVAAVLARLDE